MATTPALVPAGNFATTQWSLVLSAGQHSREALEALCEKYWPALYAYVRRNAHSVDDAHDLTQEFFLRLLERNWIARADNSKGRFRSFMLTMLKRFLLDDHDRQMAQKRGGHVHLESLSEKAESVYATAPCSTGSLELDFERDWAIALLNNVLTGLQADYARDGKQELFTVLNKYLVGRGDTLPYAEEAARLGMTEGAFKTAVSRIRQRYRERIRLEVAATVQNENEVDSELRHLFRILEKTR